MFCLRTLRELKLLKFLSEAGVCENVRFPLSSLLLYPNMGTRARSNHPDREFFQIISILDIIKPPSIEQFKEVYRKLVFP